MESRKNKKKNLKFQSQRSKNEYNRFWSKEKGSLLGCWIIASIINCSVPNFGPSKGFTKGELNQWWQTQGSKLWASAWEHDYVQFPSPRNWFISSYLNKLFLLTSGIKSSFQHPSLGRTYHLEEYSNKSHIILAKRWGRPSPWLSKEVLEVLFLTRWIPSAVSGSRERASKRSGSQHNEVKVAHKGKLSGRRVVEECGQLEL